MSRDTNRDSMIGHTDAVDAFVVIGICWLIHPHFGAVVGLAWIVGGLSRANEQRRARLEANGVIQP